MKTCKNCSRSYTVGEWGDFTLCGLEINKTPNVPLKVLGEEGSCPFWRESTANNGWGAK